MQKRKIWSSEYGYGTRMKELNRKSIEDILALAPMQEGMLFHYLKEPEKHHYFEQLNLKISGKIDIDCFEQAWNFVIETNEVLRTVFRWEKLKSPTQLILKKHTLTLRYHDFSTVDIGEKTGRIEEIKVNDRKERFDLREVPFRVSLCRVEEDKYEMIISNHHILYDGWSTGIILREFVTAYTDVFNKKNLVKPLKTKFKEFIRWNRERDRKDKEETFWKAYLKGFDTPSEFSIKRRKGKEKERGKATSSSENFQIRVDKDTREKLERFVKKYKITLAALLYSGWGILLQKYNRNDDVIFGTTVSGRRAPIKGIDDMVGLFINTLPLRIRIENHSNEKILDFLCRINQTLQVREDYENSSLVNIKEYSDIGSREELFDTVLIIENYPLDLRLKQEDAPLSLDSYSIFERTHYDLTVGITLTADDDMVLNVYFQDELFEKNAIERLAFHYISVIKNVTENPGQAITGIEIISPQEKREILVNFNTTEADYPHNKTIHQLFEEQVERVGNKIAVISMEHGAWSMEERVGIGTMSITYRELNERANRLSRLLREKGVKPDGIVAIMVERSLEMVIGILGILKSGGAYLPIDPQYPKERKHYILKDSNACILVKEVSEGIDLNPLTPFHSLIQRSDYIPTHSLTDSPTHRSLAYVIYTSGSTGQPKGVTIEHGSVVNLLCQLNEMYPFTESDVYLLKTSYLFDVSVTELFGWFMGGGKLVILGKNDEKDPQKIVDAIDRSGITHINFVPSQFNGFVDWLNRENIGKISSLKYIFLAGEALLPELVHKLKALDAHIPIENLYGPTEATVYASGYSLSQWDSTSVIPIGKPLYNLRLYILDMDNHLQGVGIPGELCIMGVGVARGYLNNPELTVEKFNQDFQDYQDDHDKKGLKKRVGKYSFTSLPLYPSTSLYRTGDLARWLPDGNIEFLDRIDRQVKIRGFRIELGEIENQLLNNDEIKEAVVTAMSDKIGDHFLCAYIVPHSSGSFDPHRLRNYLMEKLPEYMVPAHFVALSEMPLTATGKIDRKSLPAPEITSTKEYIAPRNEKEEILVEIWSEVLTIEKDRIGIDDNFFELGGHSLKATSVMTRIHKKCDIEIPLSELFQVPTIRGLSHYIQKKEKHIHLSIPLVEEKEYYPLSSPQKRFFVFQQIEPDNISYNIPEVIILEGVLLKEKIERTFKQLIYRHESLRTSFLLVEGEGVQKIHSCSEITFTAEYYELERMKDDVKDNEREKIIRNFVRPFDLSSPPLLRLGFIQVEAEKYFLMFDMHHIVSDGVSISIFIKEFLALYDGQELPPLPIQYKEYVNWMQERRQRDGGTWETVSDEIGGEEEVLNIPSDYARPAVPSFDGKTITFEIREQEEENLILLSLREDTTLYMVLLSTFNVFLSKLSGQENIVVGSPIAGRLHHDLEGLIGLFINTLVLRSFPSGEKRFLEFLAGVKANALQAFESQEYQYEELVEKIITARDTGRNPLFDVMFVMQNMDLPKIEIPSLTVIPELGENRTSKFDMTLYCEEKDTHVFKLEYNTALFKQETIQRFIRYFKKVNAEILEDPYKKISEIEIISEEEKHQILYDFNDTSVSYPEDKTIYQVFEEQVARIPERIGIWGAYTETSDLGAETGGQRVTYRELNERSNQLARILRSRGLKTNVAAGIMIERSVEMLVGIFAILKAGGAYLPIDPEYPENRIISMLDNSGAYLLLTTRKLIGEKSLPRLSQHQQQEVLLMDKLTEVLQEQPVENLEPISGPGDLIYIIFTSGSTGKPKGAGVYHRGFMNLLHWFVTEFGINEDDRNLLLTSTSFDLTQKNLYASLITGGALCLPKFNYFEPRSLLRGIRDNRVTWINCTPSMFYKLVEYDEAGEEKRLSSLRYVFLGGEPISLSTLINWLESEDCNAEIVNTYGPTECTDICNSYIIKEPRRFLEETIPLGKPVYNVQLYIPDKNLQPLPVGIPGELFIGGEGVGIGYVNDRDLTDQKFIKHSFVAGEPERLLYRTGDLVKWLPEGDVEFLGRIDHQVKVRGFRIELGEIESQLLSHPNVKESVVLAREGEGGDKYLCAYVVPHTGDAMQVAELREYLAAELPDYMVPAYFVLLEKMPLNPNGKVDRKALPEPDLTSGRDYVPPQNEREKILVNLWSDVLAVDRKEIGIHDNFFQLGGHSLKAAGLVGRIHKAFSVEIPIAELFKIPTVKGISDYIEKTRESIYSSLKPVELKEYYPLSSAQKRLFVIHQMDPIQIHITYNLPVVMILEGELEKDRMEKTFRELINRNESLRTSFEIIDEEPVQKIHQEVAFGIDFYKLTRTQVEEGTTHSPHLSVSSRHVIKSFVRPFDLSQPPLLRVGLIKVEENKHILMFDMHHIISDGVSIGIFTEEFMTFYKDEALPGLRLQYKDFSYWQNCLLASAEMKKQEAYWQKQFEGEIPVLNLPSDYVRPSVQQFEGERINFEIKEEMERLNQLALETGSTLYMVLFAAFTLFLSKLSSQGDIVVGTPVAGRRHPDLGNIIGMFVNTLAVRTDTSGQKKFRDFLTDVKENLLRAFENEDYQYEELVETVVTNRDLSRNPLFDTLFVLQNIDVMEIEIPGLRLKPYPYDSEISKFDLTLYCEEKRDGLFFSVEYSTKLFRQDTIRRFIRYFKKIVFDILNNKDLKIRGIEIISEGERGQVLYAFNDTKAEYPRDEVIHTLFEEQVEKTPDRIAVVAPERDLGLVTTPDILQLSYKKLNEQSDKLARVLRSKGVHSNEVVGIMVERSVEMILGIMSILKSGGAYLPLDPQKPELRSRFILQDCNAKLLLTRNVFSGKTDIICEVINFENLNLAKKGYEHIEMPVHSSPTDIAYLMYTSGSTGTPKGVMIEHRSVLNRLHWMQKNYPIGREDVILQKTPFTFDVSVWELFWWSFQGASVCMLDPGDEKDPEQIVNAIGTHQITTIHFVPSMLNIFLRFFENSDILRRLGSLKRVFASGEALGPDLVKRFYNIYKERDQAKLINLYGPTEATIDVSYFNCSTAKGLEKVPIGRPIDNIKLFVLDKDLMLLPVGICGELYISGLGVARGYLNQVELTKEKFLENPFFANERLYCTGDLVRWLADGDLEFLGRIDHQVKIRGFRVELGEIESKLLSHDDIREAVVLAGVEGTGDKYICAYIVSNIEFEISELRGYLSNDLPDYMIPTYFMQIEKIPLTPNGKIDRRALPAPELKAGEGYIAPRNEVEEKLTELWSIVLGVEKDIIGINSNFFEWGGQSLKATILIAKMHKAFNVKVPIAEIFKTPSIRGISQFIIKAKEDKYVSIEKVEKKDYYALHSAQKRLYLLHQMDLESTAYNMPLAVILEGVLGKAKLEDTFRKLIQRHESLRTSFHMIADEPVQKIHEDVEFEIEYYDLTAKAREDMRKQDENYHSNQSFIEQIHHFVQPFDLSYAPLLRVGLIKIEEERHVLMVDMHHIISDGISMDVFIKEFMSLYGGEELFPLGIQNKDFSEWQNSKKEKESIRRQEAYWLKEFEGEIPVLDLPIDSMRPVVQSFEGSTQEFEIGRKEKEQLESLALEQASTLYMVLLSLFNIFLAKVSGQEDIVLGSPVAGRNHPDLEQVIGIFINTLALRNYPVGEKKVKAFLREIRDKTLKAQENQEYPFEDLVELVEVNRDTSRNPLFDVMLVMQNMEKKELQIPDLKLKEYPHENKKSKFDMTFTCVEQDNKLSFTITYSTALFNKETIERFIGYFKRIVFDILENSGRSISEIDILSTEEKQRLLIDFNNTVTEYEYQEDKAIHQLFEEQVFKTPDDIAIVGTGFDVFHRGENHQFTYSEFNRMSNQLARLLRAKGVCADTITAIMTEPSLEMIVGIMAILKAGGTYLPMAPKHPDERIKYMINDSETRLLLTQASFIHRIPFEIELINIEEIDIYKGKGTNLESISGPIDLVYTIYTSGSTGKPKGVLLKHENLVNYVCWFTHNVDLIKKDRTVLTSSFGFDLGYTSVFPSILTGCQLHILREETYLSPENLISYIVKNEISYIKLTPSLFTAIVESSEFTRENSHSLRLVVLGGEEIKLKDVEKGHAIGEHIQIMNHYGPTEATIGCVARFIDFGTFEDYLKRPTIGYPIGNMKVSILDKRLNMVAVGVSGELCVSGTGVVRGYLNHPELTVEKFVAHPYIGGEQMYRTGDMARWLAGGTVEFLGRIDSQIKIRGYRIELGEIENRLFAHQAIKEAVIILRQHLSGDKYLCAYIVLNSVDDGINLSELKEYLSETLPDYMIPSHVVQLEKIPLTPNGKLNRKLLPEPESGNRVAGFVEPRDRIEKKQVELWQEILEADRIGIDDNFFQLGGHSLKAIMLASKIHKAMDVKVPLTEIFKTPTIRGLSTFIKDKYITRHVEDRYIDIVPVEKKEYYALSSAQKRLFILHQLDEIGTGYNMPRVLELEGEVDGNHLENTFKKLINRHESFRTSFEMIGDEPVQKIHEKLDFEIEYYEVNTPRLFHGRYSKVGSFEPATGSANTQTARSLIENFVRPFDLSQPPLLRVGLIHTSPFRSLRAHPPQEGNSMNKYILVVDMHHIISDAVSRELLIRDFTAIYSGEVLPPLMACYKDYSKWQSSEKKKESLKRQEAYWLREFADEIPVLNLPIDFARPVIQSFAGSTLTFKIGEMETEKLKHLALTEGSTLYMVLLALFNVFLARISRQEEIIVGSPTSGRRNIGLAQIIGIFINTLALSNYPTGEKTVKAFLREVRDNTLKAQENQEYQFEDLVEKVALNIKRDASRNPLFDVMFVLQNIPAAEIEITGLKLIPYDYKDIIRISKFDLTFICEENELENNLHFTVEYSTKLFKEETIERFIIYFKKIISNVLEDPGKRISETELSTEEEKERILYEFNDTTEEHPHLKGKTIHEMFESQAARTGDKIAVVGIAYSAWDTADCGFGATPGERSELSSILYALSYNELNKKSNQLAYLLKEKGVGPNTIVGLMVERSIEMVIGMLGILKAGGAYLPIDTNYPQERIDFMLKDSSAKVLLSEVSEVSGWNGEILHTLAAPQPPLSKGDFFSPESKESPPWKGVPKEQGGALAYVIYTSGSTGRPKGVLVAHRGIVNLVYFHQRIFGEDSFSRMSQVASPSFDAMAFEVWPCLSSGAALYIADGDTRVDSTKMKEWLIQNKITISYQPTILAEQLLKEEWPMEGVALQALRAAGDRLTQYPKSQYPFRLYNLYGPTEDSVWTTWTEVETGVEVSQMPSIGNPIGNHQVFILTQGLQLQPIGIPGELGIVGVGVARGYLNRPGLTAEKFIHFSLNNQHLTLYKTGDLARWMPDGSIEFLGRIDNQVKIRGFRIELSEIEEQLLKHKDIESAVVIVKEFEEGIKILFAFIVTKKKLRVSEIRDFLLVTLPDYMIPSYFVEIEKIPMTPNGKIDRKALPIPEVKREAEYIAPRDSIEKKLVEIWSQLLGSHETPMENLLIGINDNFFQLGGHSLKAANLISKIYKVFHVKVPLAEIFKKPTIRELSQYIKAEEKERYISIESAEEKDAYQLSSAQKRFYLLHQLDLESTAYNITEAVIMEGVLEVAKLEDTFKKLIHRHESLRTSFHMIGDEAVQRIHKEVEFRIEFYDLIRTKAEIEEGPDGAYSEALHAQCSMPYSSAIKNFIRPFDLSQAPLLRVGLLKDEEQKYILMIDMHHIVSDGISMNVLEKEFKGLYDGEVLVPIRIQYKDFSEWQNRLFQSGKIKKQQEYWIKQFEKKPPLLNLPFDYPRPEIQSTEGDRVRFELTPEDSEALKTMASKAEATLYMVLLAMFNVFLSKICRQDDIVVGSITAGRKHTDLDQVIGLFVNILPMRNHPNGEKTFIEFLREVRESTIKSLENQDYQFEELVSKVVGKRDLSRQPISDVGFTLQNIDRGPDNLSKPMPDYEIAHSRIYLSLVALETGKQVTLIFEYGKKLFKRETIEKFINYFKAIISDVIKSPWKKIKEIDMIPEDERNNIRSRIQQVEESLVAEFDID